MEKVIRNNQVAVLYSPGYGAGWYSWHDKQELVFDPVIVNMVENDDNELIEDYINSKYNLKDDGSDYVYCGGAYDLSIRWIPVGTLFRINEYDGYETIEIYGVDNYLVA